MNPFQSLKPKSIRGTHHVRYTSDTFCKIKHKIKVVKMFWNEVECCVVPTHERSCLIAQLDNITGT